jgi:hypothetical protein
MTDRELLDLAAKAAGLEFDPTYKNAHGLMVVRAGAACQSDQVLWNPLSDDGDALRLAVNLGIQIDPRNPETRVFGPVGGRVDEYHKPDAFAATRRAIVRAAAEIGKAMP